MPNTQKRSIGTPAPMCFIACPFCLVSCLLSVSCHKLYGDAGVDTLDGGDNDDYLEGGDDGSVDTLIGGLGEDVFRIEYVLINGNYVNKDLHKDYKLGEDTAF